ncbi:MAG: DNA polymerase III subunit alpha [Actinomycetota bacterium]
MFYHLHLHSQYSMLESTIGIDELVDAATRMGLRSLALTDRHVMHGAVEFYSKAAAAGIKPIIGCQICASRDRKPYSLILLCKNEAGYRNLCRIVSASHLQKQTAVPSVDLDFIKKNCSHLIALSPARQGHISTLLGTGRSVDAERALELYRKIFGSRFYLEVQRYPLKAPQTGCLSETIVRFGQKNGVPLVAANDVHYLDRKDYPAYRALFRLKSMAAKTDPLLRQLENDQHYLKAAEDMENLFKDIPAALSNTASIAAQCSLKLKLGSLNIPRFKLPSSCTQQSYLEKLCSLGFKKRYGRPQPDHCRRLQKELRIIAEMGYCGYFLVVWDIARFARKNQIPICGKGSAAGSMVSYVLGISDVDPVKNNLYFERFLNPERSQPPDIDMDVANKKREDILEYLKQRYGEKNVGRVCTFATMKPRSAIRETSRILNYSKQETDRLLDMARYEKIGQQPGYSDIFSLSPRISGKIRHLSTHPSAVIVSDSSLEEKIPLMLSEEGKIMSQYDMGSIEKLGILKIDLINSLSLTLIQETADRLKARGIATDIKNIREDDPRVFAMMKQGKTLGVFQLESTGIRNLMRKVRPSSIGDITLLISLYRPGPQQSGMVDQFIERKFGRQKVSYLHPHLEPILAETYGIILYQEQVIRIARNIAGYSYSEADMLRKAMTKRSSQKMQLQKQRFVQGAAGRSCSLRVAEGIFSYISKFASYGFLKAHAAAYAKLSYSACYLKAHFPAEFFSVILTNGSGYYPAAQYVEEARRMGITIRPPCINSDGFRFMPEKGKAIRVPLIQVKGLGPAVVNRIARERKGGGDFKNFTQFYRRCFLQTRISRAAVENLIKTGAFDFAAPNRRKLLLYFWHLEKAEGCKLDLGRIADFSLEEKLDAEKKLLGFEISARPLAFYRQELEKLNITRSSSFRSGYVLAAGRVINRRIEKTRDGKPMLFCTLEDEGGMYESVFFPKSYAQNKKEVLACSHLLIKGRVNAGDGSSSVIVSKAWGLENLKKAKQGLKDGIIKNELISGTAKIWQKKEK